MQAVIPSELLLRLIGASPERFAAVEQLLAACPEAALPAGGARESIIKIGRLEYREGFKDVWYADEHYNLRGHRKAQLCLEFLARNHAVDEVSARHFLDEIDPYVRANGEFIQLKNVRIKDYFNDPTGHLQALRQALVQVVEGTGKYYLRTGAPGGAPPAAS